MTRKGEYAALHAGVSGNRNWRVVRATACRHNGSVKMYIEAPGRIELPAGIEPEQVFIALPEWAQGAAQRIFEAQETFGDIDKLKAALES